MPAGLWTSCAPEWTIRARYARYRCLTFTTWSSPLPVAIQRYQLYQAQKAITHAAHIVRDGGVVLLAAACPEGSGRRAFEAFVEDVSGYEEVFRKFKQLGFRVGPHKAFQIAREAARIHLMLLSEIPPQRVQKFLLQPVPTLQEGFHEALSLFAEQPRIALMPYATNTIPIIQGD